jgi:hypothetical protein
MGKRILAVLAALGIGVIAGMVNGFVLAGLIDPSSMAVYEDPQ